MPSDEWSSNNYLKYIKNQSGEVDFFQAIRLLESFSDRKIKFKVNNSEAFHPNFIENIIPNPIKNTIDISVNTFGVTGTQGPLPSCFSEYLRRARIIGNKGEENPHLFIDIFHDRILHLLFDIKKRLNPLLFNNKSGANVFDSLVCSVSGLTFQKINRYLPIKKEKLFCLSMLLANRRVNFSHVNLILKSYLSFPFSIKSHQGVWRELPTKHQLKLQSLTKDNFDKLSNNTPNTSWGLGKKYWDPQGALRIDLFLNQYKDFMSYLPGNKNHKIIQKILTFATDGKYMFYLYLHVPWSQIPNTRLSKNNAIILGENAWLKINNQIDTKEIIKGFLVKPNIEL